MSDFGARLSQIFAGKKQVEIAEMLGVTHTAVRNYLSGRVPDSDKLQAIAKLTGCDLHWLLTGETRSPMKHTVALSEPSLEEVFERRVAAIVHEILNSREIQDLGTVDEMLADSLKKDDNPGTALEKLYLREGWPVEDLSVPVFDGWDHMTLEQKVKELKTFIEIDERHQERHG